MQKKNRQCVAQDLSRAARPAVYTVLFPSVSSEGMEEMSPRTPCSAGGAGAARGEAGHRRVLEQRRHLVLKLFQEHGMFPTTQATTHFQVNNTTYIILKPCNLL